MKGKWWFAAAAVLLLAGLVYLLSSGVLVGRDAGPAPGDNGADPGPGTENGDTDNGQDDDDPGSDQPGAEPGEPDETVDASLLAEIDRSKGELDRLYFQLNHLLGRYDRMEISDAEAAGGLEQVRGELIALAGTLRAVDAPAGTEAKSVSSAFAGGADLTAAAVAAMIDYLNTGRPASLNTFKEKIRSAEHFILQGEAGLEKLKRETG